MTDEHGVHDLEHIWPPYGVQLAAPDTRTASQRTADELAALRGDLVMALATIQELNRRMAVVEHRLADRAQASARPRSDAATAIAAFLRKQNVNDRAAQRDQLQIATPNAVADTLRDAGYGEFTECEIAAAMETWHLVQP